MHTILKHFWNSRHRPAGGREQRLMFLKPERGGMALALMRPVSCRRWEENCE